MAASPPREVKKVSIARPKPAVAALQSAASSPRTPLNRSVSGLYSSPSAAFRSDEENHLILEVGSRFFRAGIAGDSSPRCVSSYSPDGQRRAGDYRRWLIGYDASQRKRKRGQSWGHEHELWRVDAESVDVRLMGDKIERLAREIEKQYMLLDNRPRKVTLAVSSTISRPLLSPLLETLFNTLHPTSISLLPSSIMAVAAAGARHGLVVDLGWEETTVTAVCEYREILQRRSVRAGKALGEAYWRLLKYEKAKAYAALGQDAADITDVTFEETEEVMTRLSWCQSRKQSRLETAKPVSCDIEVPLSQSKQSLRLKIPFERLADPVETALLGSGVCPNEYDDHDLPPQVLVFRSLLSLPIDIRKLCMSRLTFTGGLSNIAGLKSRLLEELEATVAEHGWNPVKNYGSATGAVNSRRGQTVKELDQAGKLQNDNWSGLADEEIPGFSSELSTDLQSIPAHLREPDRDAIDEKLASSSKSPSGSTESQCVQGSVRAIHTLGAWAGASLVTALRIKGVVEVDRERFLQHGLSSVGAATTKKDVSLEKTRQSLAAGSIRPPAEKTDRANWTLGVWA